MPFTTCTYKWAPLSTSSFEVGSIIYIELFVKLKSTLLGVNSQSAPSSTTCVLCPVIYRPTTRVWRRLIMTKKSSQSWSYGLRIKQLWVYRMVILLSSFFIVLLHFPFLFHLTCFISWNSNARVAVQTQSPMTRVYETRRR